MYRVTSNSWESTGDGTALAYEPGAYLRDMEMVQFHPTGMVWPAARSIQRSSPGGAHPMAAPSPTPTGSPTTSGASSLPCTSSS